MGWDDPNVYYNPEKWGLAVVAEIEYSDRDFVFDTRVVWQAVDQPVYYTARSSGCSCPTPFEEFGSLAELDRLDIKALESEVREELASEYGTITPEEAAPFLERIRKCAP